MNIAIGIPAFNEEKSLAAIILQLKKDYKTIIVCDDGSSDMTGNIAEALGAILVTHKKNYVLWKEKHRLLNLGFWWKQSKIIASELILLEVIVFIVIMWLGAWKA